MSIWASTLAIEDERQWIADLQSQGIDAGVIRDGEPDFDHLDAPIIYQGSHVFPSEDDERGGSVDLAVIPSHVRYWRENPDAPVTTEPQEGHEPFLRMTLMTTPVSEKYEDTVILTKRQATRLRDELNWFLEGIVE